jgi:hypothetical protein
MAGTRSNCGLEGSESGMNEVIIRIQESGSVSVEEYKDGVKSFKTIAPDSFLDCINKSLLRGGVASGLLPRGCISYTVHDNGGKDIYIIHPDNRADITYYGSPYPDFPLPGLVFGFHVTTEGRISQTRLGVVENESHLKPTTPMFVYPFSNVGSDSRLCIGNNPLPKCQSLHTLASLTYHILGLDNNNDHYRAYNNKLGLEMRDLLALLQYKSPEFYYSDILVPGKQTLGDFIAGRS